MNLQNRILNWHNSTLPHYHAAIDWVNNNLIDGGIAVSKKIQVPYPEVTGYLIPSLLNFGHFKTCEVMRDYLLRAQHSNGAWEGSDGHLSPFDTGQILKGLLTLRARDPELKQLYFRAITRGCNYLVNQIDAGGYVHVNSDPPFYIPGYDQAPNAIHVYAMPPLLEAADLFSRPDWADAARRVIRRARTFWETTGYNETYPHFRYYVAEGLFDCGVPVDLGDLNKHFLDNCVPAYYQAAICFYKTGNREAGYSLFAEGMRHGFRGSFGNGTKYFRHDEVSWAVKFFLDAYYWKIRTAPTVSIEPLQPDDIRLSALATEDDLKQGLILDAGCGTGRYMEWLQSPHNHVAGLDIRDSDGRFAQGTLCNIPFTNKTFDCVYCVEALEHAVNQKAAVDELSRVAKKKVIIIDKCAEENGKMLTAPWERWPWITEVEGWLGKHWRNVQWKWIDDTFVKWVGSND